MIVTARRGRHLRFSVTIRGSDNTAITFASGDVMRVKIGRVPNTPTLDLDSVAPSANGSSILGSNPTTVNIVADDVSLLTPGTYDMEVGFVDESDSERFKFAEQGLFVVHDTMAGDTGTS